MFDPENLRVKPGHWLAIQNEGAANSEDFAGHLQYSMRRGDFGPRVIPGTRYYLRSRRPASLVKEQPKRFESSLFIVDAVPLTVAPELVTSGGSPLLSAPERLLPLKNHQYHMVLLSEKPDTYNYLSVLPSIRNLRLNAILGEYADISEDDEKIQFRDFSADAGFRFNIDSVYYKLTYSKWDAAVELPANAQQWTSIAYLIWCDFAPERMSGEQMTALVDWLHFGGQLIVSSDGLDALHASDLKEFLPVRPTGVQNQSLRELLPMMEAWGLQRDTNGQLVLPSFAEDDTFVRTIWEPQPGATELPKTNGLVVERAVGKGRIVVTAFPLNLTRLRGWTSMDHWFNSCLLRRPGRTHQTESEIFTANPSAPWQMESAAPKSEPVGFRWVADRLAPHQPSVFTTVEFAARDWAAPKTVDGTTPARSGWDGRGLDSYLPVFDSFNRRFAMGDERRSQAGWDDYSEVARAARSSLKEQAGITPPGRDWVLQALLIYLAILIPVNYAVFRLFRRLELAWFCIPVIAVVGAVVVVRAASLDIGFSNKRLQINVLEVPTGYSRGHLTGYGSLYSSLTTQFQFESENPTTLALPFPAANQPTEVDEAPAEFVMEIGRPIRFGPQQVLSNTMEMYQFQQMVDVGGRFEYQPAAASTNTAEPASAGDRVINRSRLTLSDVGVFRSTAPQGEIWYGRLPQLAAGEAAEIRWERLEESSELAAAWERTCFSDRAYWVAAIEAQLLLFGQDPYALPWPQAVELLREGRSVAPPDDLPASGNAQPTKSLRMDRSAVAEALERVAAKRRLAPQIRLSPELLDAALMDAQDVGLSLGSLFRAVTQYPLGPGEIRMIGWTDDAIDQWQVYPAASQSDQRSLVIAHLVQPAWPALGFDTNLAYPPRGSREDDRDQGTTNDPGEQPSAEEAIR
jgi:hypothetical protein